MYIRPTSADPKIWLVKCKFGDEKEIMENLYHKYFYFKDNKNDKKERVKIYSVASFDNLKGKIFIEAYTERDVLFAVQGMSNVYQNSIQLVPINERAQIFEYDQVPKSKIFPNQLVRIKGGNYDGDLAKVISIEDPVNKIHVALVPRIFDNLKGKTGYNVAPFSKSKTFSRPRKLLFDKKLISNEELDHIKDLHEYDGDVVKYRNFKFMDGLLIKAVRRVNLETENVSPKEDELQKIGCYIDENDVYIDKNTKKKLTVANKINVRYKKLPPSGIPGGGFLISPCIRSSGQGRAAKFLYEAGFCHLKPVRRKCKRGRRKHRISAAEDLKRLRDRSAGSINVPCFIRRGSVGSGT